jgi:hypothetical protein
MDTEWGPETWSMLQSLGYSHYKQLSDGRIAALQRLLYTTAIIVGITSECYETRYCYEYFEEAEEAINRWSGEGDPPLNWVVQKPEGRMGPGAKNAGNEDSQDSRIDSDDE